MRKVTILWLVCLGLSSLSATAQDRSLTFTGEAVEGQTFRKDIGRGLDFVLEPNPDGDTGWTIKVSPQGKPADPECEDFLWVVTPPYHFQNVRYLDTQYGIPAQDAVRNSPRDFSFVLNCADYETESKRVDLAIYSNGATKQEVDDALAKLGTSPTGEGRLWIVDSKITPGHDSSDGEGLGAIHWIKFKVEIKFPASPPSGGHRAVTR
jgi:hypothetical protein